MNQPGGNPPPGWGEPPAYGQPGYHGAPPLPYGVPNPHYPANYAPAHAAAPAKVSGYAVASLVLGVASLVVCVAAPLCAPVGLVLALLGLKATDYEATRRGRGLAIGGILLNVVGLLIGGLVVFYYSSLLYTANANENTRQAAKVDQDFYFIEERLRVYYRHNGDSLGPGGPVVAVANGSRFAAPAKTAPRVSGAVNVADLAVASDLQHPLGDFSLTVTGPRSAVVRHAPTGRELRITDIDKRISSVYFGYNP